VQPVERGEIERLVAHQNFDGLQKRVSRQKGQIPSREAKRIVQIEAWQP
jgi:hypothetical protein